jgi:hypothetical protein
MKRSFSKTNFFYELFLLFDQILDSQTDVATPHESDYNRHNEVINVRG